MRGLFRSANSKQTGAMVDSMWAANSNDLAQLKGAIDRSIQSRAVTDEKEWMQLVGGRPFGCVQAEQLAVYRRFTAMPPPRIDEARSILNDRTAQEIYLLWRMATRKTAIPASRVAELVGNAKVAESLAGKQVVLSGKNKAGERVFSIDQEIGPAIRYEIDRRTLIWERTARLSAFRYWQAKNLAQYQESADFIKGYQTLPAKDACDYCKKMSERTYKLNETPPTPHAECTHDMGCRCTLIPVFKDEWKRK